MISPYSDLKIFYHIDKLSNMKHGVITSPIYVRIKPTNRCNHHCYYCSYADMDLNLRTGVKKTDEISWEILERTINEFREIGVKAVTFSGGGEPLVYQHINEAMQMVLDSDIELSIITNGQLLCGKSAEVLSNAKWVRISMDSCNAKQFSSIRGVSEKKFDELVNNIKNFSIIKDRECEFGINCVVNHMNCDSIFQMALFAKSLGVNHIKFAARITKDLDEYHSKFKKNVINQIELANRTLSDNHFKVIDKYTEHFNFSAVFHRIYNKCQIMQIVTVIAADSKVYPCHDKAYILGEELGDLKKQSFTDIWKSYKFNEFNPMLKCNHHCVYDSRNILINKFFESDKHRNFI